HCLDQTAENLAVGVGTDEHGEIGAAKTSRGKEQAVVPNAVDEAIGVLEAAVADIGAEEVDPKRQAPDERAGEGRTQPTSRSHQMAIADLHSSGLRAPCCRLPRSPVAAPIIRRVAAAEDRE